MQFYDRIEERTGAVDAAYFGHDFPAPGSEHAARSPGSISRGRGKETLEFVRVFNVSAFVLTEFHIQDETQYRSLFLSEDALSRRL